MLKGRHRCHGCLRRWDSWCLEQATCVGIRDIIVEPQVNPCSPRCDGGNAGEVAKVLSSAFDAACAVGARRAARPGCFKGHTHDDKYSSPYAGGNYECRSFARLGT